MSWADIKRRYESSEGTATQSTEDMAARRILRALGITEGVRLTEAERAAGTYDSRKGDTTLLERAVALACKVADSAFCPPPPVMDVSSYKAAEAALLDLAETSADKANRPTAIVYRIKGGKDVRTIMYIGDIELLDMTRVPIPCTIHRSGDGKVFIGDCDAYDFYSKIIHKSA